MLYTVVFYNFILLFSTILLYVSEREKTALGRMLCLILAFLVTTIPNAIRFEIGSDYPSYVAIFDELAAGGTSYVEPGFLYLNKIVYSLGLGYEWLFFVIAIFIHTFAFLAYPKKNKYIAHLFFMLLFYFSTFNILRQMMAVVVVMYALKLYMLKENNFKYFSMIAFASFFHYIALVFFFIPFVNNRVFIGLIGLLGRGSIIILVLIFLFGGQLTTAIVNLLSVVPALDYTNYLNAPRYGGQAEIQTGLGVFFQVIFCLYPLLFFRKLIIYNKHNALILALLIIYLSLWGLQKYVSIFYRPKEAFQIVLIFLIPAVLSSYFIPLRRLYVGLFGLFLFLVFNNNILNSHTDYKVTCNSGRLAPYVTVFNKEYSQRGDVNDEIVCYEKNYEFESEAE